jgi:hypothetical protein
LSLTLLVENNPRIESCYMLNLSTWLGLEIVPKKKAEFAIKLLETDASKIKLIICRVQIEKEESGKAIIEYLYSKGIKIPVILIGPGKIVPGCIAHVPNSLLLKDLIQNSAKALNITAKDMSTKVVPEHFPIPITYFKVIKRSICNVYSQNLDNPKQYDLRINKLTEFTEADIQPMIQEGVTHLYVNKLDRLEFVNNVTSELITLLEGTDLSPSE